jgi:hypothetical protein
LMTTKPILMSEIYAKTYKWPLNVNFYPHPIYIIFKIKMQIAVSREHPCRHFLFYQVIVANCTQVLVGVIHQIVINDFLMDMFVHPSIVTSLRRFQSNGVASAPTLYEKVFESGISDRSSIT